MKLQAVYRQGTRRRHVISRLFVATFALFVVQTLQTSWPGVVLARNTEVVKPAPDNVELMTPVNKSQPVDDNPLKKTKSIGLNRQESSLSSLFREPAECAVFASYGINELTPIDILVKASDTDNACIKARFALSIKVEEAQSVGSGDQTPANQTSRPILGFVPLEHVISVEESCPAAKTPPPAQVKNGTDDKDDGQKTKSERSADEKVPPSSDSEKTTSDSKEEKSEDDDELEMIVTFDCGKLSFTFRRDKERVYVSAIKGLVKLDQKIVREFVVMKPMFLTSDLDHHFKI